MAEAIAKLSRSPSPHRRGWLRLRLAAHPLCVALLVAPLLGAVALRALAQEPAGESLPEGGGAVEDAGVVIEQLVTDVRFEPDGRSTERLEATARIVSEAGVQRWGQLVFTYNAATQAFSLVRAEVTKPDGTIVPAPQAGIQDRAAAVDAQVAVYTDLREVHVAMPQLRPGDLLRYVVETRTEEPLAPDQFWYEHYFERGLAVAEETLTIRVPSARTIQLSEEGARAEIVEEDRGGVRLYRWSAINTKPYDEEALYERLQKGPDVRLSSFGSWAEVGGWYHELSRARARADNVVRAKAAQLTAEVADPVERVRALYDFVSKEIRYVSLSFGLGRYQPHHPREILERGYGDCKDKHTLLAALLDAIAIEARPVLIHSTAPLTEDLPSPAQFDHVITAVTLDGTDGDRSGDRTIWLDATPGVAPFGMLSPSLRGKQALLVAGGGQSVLDTTPSEQPFTPFVAVNLEGELSALGVVSASFEIETRGDIELGLRLMYASTPKTGWTDATTWMLWSMGIPAEVSEVDASDPTDTTAPLRVRGRLRTAPFDGTGGRERLRPIAGLIALPAWPDENTETEAGNAGDGAAETARLETPLEMAPLKMDERLEVSVQSRLRLPSEVTARKPLDVDLKRPYATYKSHYAVEDGVLESTRSLRHLLLEVSAADRASYESFSKTVVSDVDQVFVLDWSNAVLDPTAVTDIDELEAAASVAVADERLEDAVRILQRIEALEPHHARAWMQLALVYLRQQRFEEAASLLRERLAEKSPEHPASLLLGEALLGLEQTAEAIQVLRDHAAAVPLDPSVWASLGRALYRASRYAEAADALERGASLQPGDLRTLALLGASYVALDRLEEGTEVLLRAEASSDVEALLAAAAVAVEKQLNEPARRLLRRVTTLDPNHSWAWRLLAYVQAREGNTELAASSLERHLELVPDDEYALWLQKYIAGETSETPFAAGAVDPETRAAQLLSVVHSHVQRGDEQAALRVIEELMAFTDEPSVKVGAALLLGRARIDLPGSEKLLAEGLEGLAATADGLSIESDVASVEQLVYWISQGWFTHGWLAFMNNELDAALEYLQSSLWLKPEAYVAETIAQIHELRRDLEPAKRYFALALALPGRASSARGSLAQLLGSEGMVDAAIEAARRSFADSQQLEIGTDLMATFLAEDSDLLIKISAQGKILAARSLSEDGEVQRIAAGGVGREFALAIPGRDLESLLVRGVLRCAPGATASDQQDRQGDEVGYDCSIRLIAPRTP